MIESGIGAGTVDLFNSYGSHIKHKKEDVKWADYAMILDGSPDYFVTGGDCFDLYIQARPINGGKKCKGLIQVF